MFSFFKSKTKKDYNVQLLSSPFTISVFLFPPGVPSEFVVNTANAGSGTLSVNIDGPSKVKMDCRECPEGFKITYTPMAPGNYLIAIKYGGPQHIVGSPFKAKITGQLHTLSSNHDKCPLLNQMFLRNKTGKCYVICVYSAQWRILHKSCLLVALQQYILISALCIEMILFDTLKIEKNSQKSIIIFSLFELRAEVHSLAVLWRETLPMSSSIFVSILISLHPECVM